MDTYYPDDPFGATGTLQIPSFTDPNLTYAVFVSAGAERCSCPAMKYDPANEPCKHLKLALLILRHGLPKRGLMPGMLAGEGPRPSRRVLVIENETRCYTRRTFGFAPGVWDHALCFDGDTFLVESTRLYRTDRSTITPVHDPALWRRQVPESTHVKGRARKAA